VPTALNDAVLLGMRDVATGIARFCSEKREILIASRRIRRYIATARPQGQIAAKEKHSHMASGPMTKSQLINFISEEAEVPRKTAARMLEVLGEAAYKEAKKGFTIPGLGKLVLVNRKARMGRNPATGATIKIPAKKVLKFRIAKAAKDAILTAKK
jgi:DNA-binding protein HU-beta